ncbi:hypothetical protein M758_9G125600 [Ceratodon purpureus]|nr:hypothetical protein M758_9G125600 [Ceratodon purpureus]
MDLHHHHLDISPKIFQQLKRMLHLGSHVSHLICTSWLGLTVVLSISCCEYGSPFNCITTRRRRKICPSILSGQDCGGVQRRLWHGYLSSLVSWIDVHAQTQRVRDLVCLNSTDSIRIQSSSTHLHPECS